MPEQRTRIATVLATRASPAMPQAAIPGTPWTASPRILIADSPCREHRTGSSAHINPHRQRDSQVLRFGNCAAGQTFGVVLAGDAAVAARCTDLISGYRVRMGCARSASRLACWCGWQLAVVAGVVETPWTGGASPDTVRHRRPGTSAHAGLHGRGEPAWMGAGLLITQRSQVQILPPLPGKTAPEVSFPGPFSATCDQTPGHIPCPIAGRFPISSTGICRSCSSS